MNTKMDSDGWCYAGYKADETSDDEEVRYYSHRMYANAVDTIEMMKPKVSLLSLDEVREKQVKNEECKNIPNSLAWPRADAVS